MSTLRDIRRRISSVKNTRKITRAMKLVASAKMHKAKQAAANAQPYQRAVQSTLRKVLMAEDSLEHPLLTTPLNDTDIVLVAFSSNRGLCGSFNSQIIKHVTSEIETHQQAGKKVSLILYGKKLVNAIKKNDSVTIVFSSEEAAPTNFDEFANELGARLTDLLQKNQLEKAILCYNKFESVIAQTPMSDQVLPMKLEKGEDEFVDYIFEPNPEEILGSLLPLSLRSQLLQAFLDTEAGEQSARMQAMENATKNAGEMIDRLSLEYNRARQAAITTELTEIISGAEAL